MKDVKKLCVLVLSLLFVLLFFIYSPSSTVSATLPSLPSLDKAESVYLYCIENKTVVAEKNSGNRIFPASTVKLMTGLLAAEKLEKRMSETVTITPDMLGQTDGTSMKLKVGDKLLVADLFYGAICGGFNDAANVLAVLSSGSVDTFVSEMNIRARNLGMTGTHYKNPTGWHDDGMYTTINDTAVIAQKALKNELYVKASSSASYTVEASETTGEFTFYNRNCLISANFGQGYINKDAQGLIAGMTDEGGYCVATFTEYKGFTYVCVVMGAVASENKIYSYEIANSLLDYALSAYKYREVLTAGEKICEVSVKFATTEAGKRQSSVSAVVEKSVSAALPADADIENGLTRKFWLYEKELNAPVREGQKIGGIDVYYGDEIVASGELIAKKDIRADGFLLFIENAKKFLLSRTVIISLISFIILFGIYYYFSELRSRKKTTKNISYKNIYR